MITKPGRPITLKRGQRSSSWISRAAFAGCMWAKEVTKRRRARSRRCFQNPRSEWHVDYSSRPARAVAKITVQPASTLVRIRVSDSSDLRDVLFVCRREKQDKQERAQKSAQLSHGSFCFASCDFA